MRPSHLSTLVIGVLIEIGVVAAAVGFWVAESHHAKPWHYWIAPLLALQTAALLLQIAIGYWWRVGRLEMRGRPRSG